jgi:rhamnosyltransferase
MDEIGGFSPIIFGEDTIAVAKLLHRGHRIAYVAEAIVHHSHDYTLKQEFCRHFDMGASRKSHQELFAICGSDNAKGKAYVQDLLKELWQIAPFQIPYALLQTIVKYIGYRLGRTK